MIIKMRNIEKKKKGLAALPNLMIGQAISAVPDTTIPLD